MIILKNITIKNYRNLEKVILSDCKDFNILIGPSNCGKTNILCAINILKRVNLDFLYNYQYQKEKSVFPISTSQINILEPGKLQFYAPRVETNEEDAYRKTVPFEIEFEFNEEVIRKNLKNLKEIENIIINELYEKIKQRNDPNLTSFFETIFDNKYKIKLLQEPYSKKYALSNSLSYFFLNEFKDFFEKRVLFIEDSRIKKERNFIEEYLKNKELSGKIMNELITRLNEIVDNSINDFNTANFNLIHYENDKEIFEAEIIKEGSGIRSLVLPIADIISLESLEEGIILWDEPEIGLYPYSKQKLLEFLLKKAKSHQIFITTHDPTFINPILWKNKEISISIYLYSSVENNFIKINLNENMEDPNVFAGYLPHTHSLKEIHIYVEGSSDVYIFQIFLRKYVDELNQKRKINKYEMLNKVGIYHLGGSFWLHLLSTIPSPPYKSVVILDGDKKKELENMKYDIQQRFKICHTIDEIGEAFSENLIPIYCLQKEKIEKYLFPEGEPANYEKKIHGPQKAEEMKEIPKEIKDLLEKILDEEIVLFFKSVI